MVYLPLCLVENLHCATHFVGILHESGAFNLTKLGDEDRSWKSGTVARRRNGMPVISKEAK